MLSASHHSRHHSTGLGYPVAAADQLRPDENKTAEASPEQCVPCGGVGQALPPVQHAGAEQQAEAHHCGGHCRHVAARNRQDWRGSRHSKPWQQAWAQRKGGRARHAPMRHKRNTAHAILISPAEMPRESPATHRHTAAPMVASMIFSSRLMGPIFSRRSAASCKFGTEAGVRASR